VTVRGDLVERLARAVEVDLIGSCLTASPDVQGAIAAIEAVRTGPLSCAEVA
jgi:hypothetical protein